MKRSHLIIWIPCVLYYLFITALSHIPGDNLPITMPFAHFDKVVHFLMYSLLGIIVSRALSWEEHYHHLKKRWYVYFILIIVFATSLDEIHQHFVPFREMDFFDGLADFSGASLGGYIYFYILLGNKKSASDLDDSTFLEKDNRGMGLVLALFYFVVLVSLNLLDYRAGLLKKYSHLGFVLTVFEYGLLGFLTIRFFYLRKSIQFFNAKDWLMLTLFGSVFICFIQLSFHILNKPILTSREILWAWLSFVIGAVFYYLDKQIDKFRKKIFENPRYKRKTWQRIYFFSPFIFVMMGITFMSSQGPQPLYETYLPFPHQFFPASGILSIFRNYFFLHTLQFFVLGLFYFRAIAWESWWHDTASKRKLWIISGLVFVAHAFLDEYHQSFVKGRVGEVTDSLMNVLGGVIALILYLYGYRVMKEKYFKRKKFLGFPV